MVLQSSFSVQQTKSKITILYYDTMHFLRILGTYAMEKMLIFAESIPIFTFIFADYLDIPTASLGMSDYLDNPNPKRASFQQLLQVFD